MLSTLTARRPEEKERGQRTELTELTLISPAHSTSLLLPPRRVLPCSLPCLALPCYPHAASTTKESESLLPEDDGDGIARNAFQAGHSVKKSAGELDRLTERRHDGLLMQNSHVE